VEQGRPETPDHDGDLLVEPPLESWAGSASQAAAAVESWRFTVAGTDARVLRALARAEAIERARTFSERLGVALHGVPDTPTLIVATGHQPEIYHPGVWVKDFLLERAAQDAGAAAIDLVVDSDGFDSVGVHVPCMDEGVRACHAELAIGTAGACFACAPVPSAEDLHRFRADGERHLATLADPAPARRFGRFCDGMEAAAVGARNVAELVTIARRRYEAPAGTGYLELPVTSMAASRAFATFVVHLALNARAFALAYNGALSAYRTANGTRNPAQPFPDLAIGETDVELPLWSLFAARTGVRVRAGAVPALIDESGVVLCDLGADPAIAVERLLDAGLSIAPKALALTLFTRMFVSDLFIHGVGGAAYDTVTDDVARSFFGVEPPPFVVASLTLLLPLGEHVTGDDEVAEAAMALNRLAQNPDQMLSDVEFASAEDAARAADLADEKSALVASISRPDADKKQVGMRIREVNAKLAALLEPKAVELRARLARVTALRDASAVLTDRTYPFCLFDPLDVAERVRAV
jgi:hypothetical protein